MNYKSFNLADWICHISGVIENETTLDGNEMRDLVEFLSTLEQETWSLDDAREDFMHDVYNTLDFLPTNDEANRIIDSFDRVTSSIKQEPRKGEWLRMSDLSEQEDDRYKCSCCGNVIHHKNKMDLYTFNSWCGRCGSDNGRHIKYEVEE